MLQSMLKISTTTFHLKFTTALKCRKLCLIIVKWVIDRQSAHRIHFALSHSLSQLVILSNVNWHPVMMKKRKQITEYWSHIKELPSSSSSSATAMEFSQKLIEKQLESQHKNGLLKEERTEREQLKTFLCCSTAVACA